MKQLHPDDLNKVITFDGKQMTLAEFDALPHDWEYQLNSLPKANFYRGRFKVYVILNKLNGRLYFGMTGQEPEQRWRGGKGYGGQKLGRAIEEYGWNNFAAKVLVDGMNLQQAQQCERWFIARYHTDGAGGYNETAGGEYLGEYEPTGDDFYNEDERHAAERWFERRTAWVQTNPDRF